MDGENHTSEDSELISETIEKLPSSVSREGKGKRLWKKVKGIGALIYATRIPERWMPGKFDIAEHSYQLFHVLVVAGAYTHYQAGLVYLKWRDLEGCRGN